VIDLARQLDYRVMRLDTLAWMKPAITLYSQLGFRRIEPYCYNPQHDAVYMELSALYSASLCNHRRQEWHGPGLRVRPFPAEAVRCVEVHQPS
jgi:hypothetical protein